MIATEVLDDLTEITSSSKDFRAIEDETA